MKKISKIILTLTMCTWIGNGTSIANTSHSNILPPANWEVQQRRPPHERPIHRIPIMSKQDFQYLYKVIKKKSFNDDRLELLSVGVLDNYFSCKQCATLIAIFSFDSNKLEALDIMAKHIVDLENAGLILESFAFDSSRQKAAKILGLH